MTAETALVPAAHRRGSAFAGGDVCALAGLRVADGAVRPVFEQDRWLLTGLADAHRMVSRHELTWDFTQIRNPAWRVVAKEILLAQLAPQHEAALECPHAVRTARSPRTCYRWLRRLADWFNWLTEADVATLGEVTQEMCERHFEEQSWTQARPGRPRRRQEPSSVVEIPHVLQAIAIYSDLLSTDRYQHDFVPWNGLAPDSVVGAVRSRDNLVAPVPDSLLQPLLATCLFLVDTVGPHLAALAEHARVARARRDGLPIARVHHLPGLHALIATIRARGEPLPAVSDKQVSRWSDHAGDPLRALAWGHLASQGGFCGVADTAKPRLRPVLLDVVQEVGLAGPWAREADLVTQFGTAQRIPWTTPLTDDQLRAMIGNVLTACLVVTAALSGMRASELLELEVGCRQASQRAGGGTRVRLAGRLIKGQRFGGKPDQWVVIDDVDRAVAVAERLTGHAAGEALFGNVGVPARITAVREWLRRTGLGAHWNLPEIPEGTCTPRMLRRTLALAIAHRPGGLLAAKVALKHISVATSEGYAAYPGGAQRKFHTEVATAEEQHHLQLTVQAFRDVQAGVQPAGPGARGLLDAFAHVNAALAEAADTNPAVLASDRHLENLLRKRAATLHIGPANYCWFSDPAKALCLRLAGTPDATRPLVGMCDSARCPQATHHACHRPVWAAHAAQTQVLLDNPRVPKGEKTRLQPELDRTRRVLAEIDAAAPPQEDHDAAAE